MGNGDVGFSKLSYGMQTLLALLLIIGAIVPCVLGFVNLDKRQDVLENSHMEHVGKVEKKWDKTDMAIDGLQDEVHSLQLIDKELEIKYREILRRMDEFREEQKITNMKLDNLVRVD
jgi:hypothetical protein